MKTPSPLVLGWYLDSRVRFQPTHSPDDASVRFELVFLIVFQWKVTARVLEDGSYTKLLNKESLSEDLGTKGREAVRVVGMRVLWTTLPLSSPLIASNMNPQSFAACRVLVFFCSPKRYGECLHRKSRYYHPPSRDYLVVFICLAGWNRSGVCCLPGSTESTNQRRSSCCHYIAVRSFRSYPTSRARTRVHGPGLLISREMIPERTSVVNIPRDIAGYWVRVQFKNNCIPFPTKLLGKTLSIPIPYRANY